MKIDKALADLIKISNTVGKDTKLVQGGGGNTSVKTNDGRFMYIKASGSTLKDMNAEKGWRMLDVKKVLSILPDKDIAKLDVTPRETEVVRRLACSCADNLKSNARPSVEAHLHAMLDKYVIHLHPDAVRAFVNAKDGQQKVDKIFNGWKNPPLWIPYVDPGFMLAKKISALINKYQSQYKKKPAVLFLEKHGLIISSESMNTSLKLVSQVVKIMQAGLKCPWAAIPKVLPSQEITNAKHAIRKAYYKAAGKYVPVKFFIDNTIAGFLKHKNIKKMLSCPCLSPDELVYANGTPIWLETVNSEKIAAKLSSQIKKGEKLSKAFLVKGLGLFVTAPEKTAGVIRDIVSSSLFIRHNALSFGGIKPLRRREIDFVNNWESEAFRQKAAGNTNDGQLKDKIAVVTGAGSGLGKSIAIGLAKAGAFVTLADIDSAAAQQTKSEILKELPSAEVIVAVCNVTDESSVKNAFSQIMDEFGGLDILVNAAGIAPAYSLVDMPADKWRLALEINLTGYLLMAKYAAKIMIAQGIGGSIINLSSKSGLEASKNNTPYNATKAGEIHMARGWAMELGKYGIRVNSICPGNVFEGSKIWNPEYIKICAKKYGIRPEEVIPYYVNKTILGVEIKGQDIADAVIFLSSDQSRVITGQTLVVDSGQVMVR
ncbi:MAG: SDR family oxidoreductase [Phycisphaerae bacterium]|jgi:NAD(P)-dependent dehydrogenase (short-subunit alcohol dehydrogenase family)/rhamnose utilization protein RhaD (predicted bifunctional aldolase and dehydrogenase)